jgi:hypothetical protein
MDIGYDSPDADIYVDDIGSYGRIWIYADF